MGKIEYPVLLRKDCFKIIPTLKDHSIDLVVTDPPYNVKAIGYGGTLNDVKGFNKSLIDLTTNTDITKGYDIRGFSELIVPKMKDINIYFWCNKKQIPEYLQIYVTELKCAFEIISWHKVNALPSYSNKYLTDTEYCLYFHKGHCKPNNYEDAKTYFMGSINHKDKKLYGHPSIKPLDYIETFIRNSSKKGEIVFDPFMGSGTTGVACNHLKRKFIGCEIDKTYFKIAKDRIYNE